jgi:hypothetical protein
MLAAVFTFLFGCACISLLAVPLIRSAEWNESGGAKERCEDATVTVRRIHGRCPGVDVERIAFASKISSQGLGRPQHRPTLCAYSPSGHRLTHDLLAHLTC